MLRGHAVRDQGIHPLHLRREHGLQSLERSRGCHRIVSLRLDLSFQDGYAPPMKEILRTNDPTVIAFATALLRGEDIECFVMDVHMSVLEGSIGILPRRVMVRREDAFRASAILRDNEIEAAG